MNDTVAADAREDHGIEIHVKTSFLPGESDVQGQRYFFAYTIRIVNRSSKTVQLLGRHWIITHGNGRVEEVRGQGVVGKQPILHVDESFEYSSGCPLSTPHGTMHGSYHMLAVEGEPFEVKIHPFSLSVPYTLH